MNPLHPLSPPFSAVSLSLRRPTQPASDRRGTAQPLQLVRCLRRAESLAPPGYAISLSLLVTTEPDEFKGFTLTTPSRYFCLERSLQVTNKPQPRSRRLRRRRITTNPEAYNDDAPGCLRLCLDGVRDFSKASFLLRDVCSSSIRVALELYCATRDAILLYEAIIPVRMDFRIPIKCSIFAVKIPIAILAAEIDHASLPEELKKFGEIISAKKFESYMKIFPSVNHGWSVRWDHNNKFAIKSAEEGKRTC